MNVETSLLSEIISYLLLPPVENILDSDVVSPSKEGAEPQSAEPAQNSHSKSQKEITLFDLKEATKNFQNLLHLLPQSQNVSSDLQLEIFKTFESINILRENLRPFLSVENDFVLNPIAKNIVGIT